MIRYPVLLWLISFNFAFAQKDYRDGYIVTLTSDTVRGLLIFRTPGKLVSRIEFKTCGQKNSTVYDATNLTGFGYIDGAVYESKVIDRSSYSSFYQKVVSGKASLYNQKGNYFLETDSVVQLKQIGVKRKVGSRDVVVPEYLLTLQREFSACSNALLLNEVKYNESDLIRSVSEYNHCVGSSSKIFNTSKASSSLEVYAVAGYAISSFSIQGEGQPASAYLLNQSVPGIAAGLGFSLLFPRYNDKWLFIAEANFSYYNHTKTQYYEIPDPSQMLFGYSIREDHIMLPSLIFPLGIKYNLGNPQASITLGGGMQFKTYINPSIYSTGSFVVNDQVVSQYVKYEYNVENLPNAGLWMSAGFSTVNHKNNRSFFEMRISNDFPREETKKMFNFSLMIGTSF